MNSTNPFDLPDDIRRATFREFSDMTGEPVPKFLRGDKVRVTKLEGIVSQDVASGVLRIIVIDPTQEQEWIAVIPENCVEIIED